MAVAIYTLKLGTMDNFIHSIIDEDSREGMLVDPAWDADIILHLLAEYNYTLKGILLTHSHADHISAVDTILAQCPVPVYISRPEFRLGLARFKNPHYIADGESITLGNNTITAIATPGHTIGSMSFYVDKHVIVGDTLFIDGCGRCNFYESNVEQMWDSLQRLKQLPDDTLIYCGHDYGQKTIDTLGKQKQTNPYLLIEDKAFFIDFRMNLQAQYRSIPFAPSSREEIDNIYLRHKKTA